MRIAVVNDVVMAAEAVSRAVLSARHHQLAWIANDGAEAVELCARDAPDLILMDLVMPRMDGVEATRRIMAHTPCPILIVTASVARNTSRVFEAMGAGALDAVKTPILASGGSAAGVSALLAKIETIHKLIEPNHFAPAAFTLRPFSRRPRLRNHLLAVGASAGGPSALAAVLSDLPANFPEPIVIVQHVDPHFGPGLAHWLQRHTKLRVRLAREGDEPQPGTVFLATGERHLVFDSSARLAYHRHPIDSSYSPSIDVFFKSADQLWPGEIIGVLLTGMGRDGAEGLRLLRHHGHHTITQDQATSAVYGMPKAASDLRAASEVLPLGEIAARLTRLILPKPARHD